ncbi:conserved hypothetical protein [Beutenbergia cavernae DSM 12333]|uniref:Uncharacterized protein n=1 Tax=Beutenbergia cavernae (strain ATCC BAA-8 / DSM 12333 / CCUG 43141 / JCM 11478 / NBRC 16432 / NCIMB 13614 / HKI 0122) TaxID=471853 RepID=C5C2Y1_BEUC1|nr:hypothetical protein [Beutenbergia cavernae]ACQ81825.1 conserved hypothetical protein [Beutenbergia cavernae DSM 12333]
MLTEFTRDALFTAGWFGLMAMVWFGWAQEAPPRSWRVWLGAGSVVGTLLAVGCGVAVPMNWDSPSALEGRYAWFGVLVAVDVLAAGVGCWVLARRGAARWMAWWVALVVAVHFLPLAWLLEDAGMALVGAGLTVALLVLRPRLRDRPGPTSAVVGVTMGATLLAAGLVAAAVGVPQILG